MEIRLLGPTEIIHAGQVIAISARKPRTLLAILAARAGTTVSSPQLIEELWRGEPPPSAANTLQTYVNQLRRVLEPDRGPRAESRVLRRMPDGYRLETDDLDIVRFVDAVQTGISLSEQRKHAAAAAALADAVALWRGSPFADADECATIIDEARRLTALLRQAKRVRAEADLRLGRAADAVRGLTGLLDEDPFDEAACALLMTALCRAGNPTAALRAYQDLRTALHDQLGTEPTRPLRDLHETILRHDTPDHGLTGDVMVQPEQGESDDDRRHEIAPTRGTSGRGITSSALASTHTRRRRQVLALCAVALAGLLVVWLTLGQMADEPQREATERRGNIVNQYHLDVYPGTAYDLDVLPGDPTDRYVGSGQDDPGWDHLDLYRTMSGPDQINGVDITRTGRDQAYNVVRLVPREAGPADCLRLPTQGGGKVMLYSLAVRDKVCVRTNQQRWVLLTVDRVPPERLEPMRLLVTVLRP